jgi:hypothetical protein
LTNGKETVLNYCGQFSASSIEHMEQAIENKKLIEKGDYKYLNGCPSNFGLDDHAGICEIEETDNYTEPQKLDMCERCWKQALGVSEKKE